MQSPIEYLRERYGYHVLRIFRVFIPAALAVLLLTHVPRVRMCYSSEGFQPTMATIEDSGVEPFDSERWTTWIVRLRYSYDVGGRRYHSELYDPFGPCVLRWPSSEMRRIDASEALAPFQAGKQIAAWYDPNDPARAVVRRGREVLKAHIQDLAQIPAALIVTIILWRIPAERYRYRRHRDRPDVSPNTGSEAR